MIKVIDRSSAADSLASSDVEVCTGCLKRGTAAIHAMLPGAAVILGMAAFGLVVHFTA